ncbi:MAG TPA: DNA translocase FtsK [Thermoanaerobaculia bacterium]|nr:DNA translocase FtsK [Thermoanaerobaculia bacterium]HUM29494.1 DNA translocase FtsK [Thermoanaerobaculia bacterium]HXK67877.1 DNA translocase FtsK [Thermoanaerobaculia bacterium]
MESDKFFREIIGFTIIIVSLFLLLAFVSHNPGDPSILNSQPAGEPYSNLLGPIGASTSALFFQVFGLISFIFPAVVFVTGIRWFLLPASRLVPLRIFGFCLLVLFLPALSALILLDIHWRGQIIRTGGWFGETVRNLMVSLIGITGATIFLLFFVLLGLFFWTSLGPSEYFRRISDLSARVIEWFRSRMSSYRQESRSSRVIDKQYERLEESGIIVTKREGTADLKVRRVSRQTQAPPAETKAPVKDRDRTQTHAPAPPQQLSLAPPSRHEYVLPPSGLLDPSNRGQSEDAKQLVQLGKAIEAKLAEFQINGSIAGINPGPVVTVFEFKPAAGIKISRILGYQDDLALALQTTAIRIERVPNKSTVGIEVPNRSRQMIRLRDIVEFDGFAKAPSLLTLAMGVDLRGEPIVSDLSIMPHLLIGGTTGSGKSVGINAMIMSVLLRAKPDEVKFIMVDPKRVEMKMYDNIPHLLTPIITSPKKAAQALAWAVSEMESRYKILAEAQVRNISSYQKRSREERGLKPMPYIVIVIDELADMLMVASKEVEDLIIRLAQMARAVGIHLILATQRPDKDVVTGLIKANIPARVAYTVSSGANSRVILDSIGAEKLLGDGDMLFIPPGTSRKVRLHGPYVSEVEVARVCKYIRAQKKPEYQDEVTAHPVPDRKGPAMRGEEDEVDDSLFFEAVREVIQSQQASASHLQRRLRVGYTRAARLIDLMEARGVVGPGKGARPRDILVGESFLQSLAAEGGSGGVDDDPDFE